MRPIITILLLTLLPPSLATPLPQSPTGPPSEINAPCGGGLPDCASPLTCIPLSVNCTEWTTSWSAGCPGTCQALDVSRRQIYTLCGGWALLDDCDERVERCVADPRRRADGCGPSCDGPGICWPFGEWCDDEGRKGCEEGKACFLTAGRDSAGGEEGAWGRCFPLRFGSDYYEKTGLEEVYRTDQDGWSGEEGE